MSHDRKVLIIENDIRISTWLKKILEERGYSVLLSTDSLEGLETAIRETPDLVILDFFLSNLDGYWVSAFIKRNKALKKTRILAFSSRTTERMQRILEDAGIDLFIQVEGKTVSGEKRSELLEKIEILVPEANTVSQ
jgi:DNA-binding response OmpR family regulator